MRLRLLAGTALLLGNTPLPAPTATPATVTPTAAAPTSIELGFAATLAQTPAITSQSGWRGTTGTEAWHALAIAAPQGRQAARWHYALGLIGEDNASDALGVLDVMLADEKDLALAPNFQLARGAALAMLDRDQEAVTSLAAIELAQNPEACAWRLLAFSHAAKPVEALRELHCALPAINARHGADRAPFVLAAASAALDTHQFTGATRLLNAMPDTDGAANVLRGRALLGAQDLPGAKQRFERAAHDADPEVAAGANLGLIETGLALHALKPGDAITKLDALRYGWRGGEVEEGALRLQFSLAGEMHDLQQSLRAGATLVRYFQLGPDLAPMMAQLQDSLAATLAPGSTVPLPQAAGVYWDYRELAPAGAAGDAMVFNLAGRLQEAGLYARAAELLGYQLKTRANDVSQGPLSVKVAALHILAGAPQRALDALHDSEQPGYTEAMIWDRKRMEAVALHQLGKTEAALAALDGVPDGAAIRAEIEWRAKDWNAFVADTQGHLPPPRGLNDPARAAILRHAIALAMLGLEDRLAALRARYAPAFKGQPGEDAFDVLTSAIGTVDPARIEAAMASIPAASPPASIGDLLDAGH